MPRAEAKYRITAQDQTQQGLRSAEGRLRRFFRIADAGAVALGNFLNDSIRSGFSRLSGLVRSVQEDLIKLRRAASEVGTTTEDFALLAKAAESVGVDADRAASLVDALGDAIGDALQDPNSEKAELFRDVLGIDPRTIGNIDDVSSRVLAYAAALEKLEETQGRFRREFVEQSLTGDDFSKLLDTASLSKALSEVESLNLTQGLNESAAAAERAANAWRLAGEVWLAILRDSRFFALLEVAGRRTAQIGQEIRSRRVEPTSVGEDTLRGLSFGYRFFRFLERAFSRDDLETGATQRGAFVPQSVQSQEALTRAARANEKTSQAVNRSAEQLERVLNRYAP